jgi:hypothetical protein
MGATVGDLTLRTGIGWLKQGWEAADGAGMAVIVGRVSSASSTALRGLGVVRAAGREVRQSDIAELILYVVVVIPPVVDSCAVQCGGLSDWLS